MHKNVQRFLNEKFIYAMDVELMAEFLQRHPAVFGPLALSLRPENVQKERAQILMALTSLNGPGAEAALEELHRIATIAKDPAFGALRKRAERLGIDIVPRDARLSSLDMRCITMRAFLRHPELFGEAEDWWALERHTAVAEYLATDGFDVFTDEQSRKLFEEAAAELYDERYREPYCRARWYEADGKVHVVITHGVLPVTTLRIDAGHEECLTFREAKQDILRFLIGGLVGVIRIVAPVIRLVGWLGGVLVSAFRLGFQAAAKFFLPLRMLIEALRHVGRMVEIVWGVLMGEVSLGDGFRAAGESLREFLLTPLHWLQDVAAATWRALGSGISFVAGLFMRIGGAIVAGIQRLPVVAAVRGIVAEIGALFRGERSFLEAGTRIVAALARGLLGAATLPVRVVRGLMDRLMGLFSGSAEGGRSAGRRIVAALAAGLAGLVGLPGRLLARALAPVAGLVAGAVGRIVGAGQAAVGRIIAPFRWLLGVASMVWQQLAAGARIGWSLLVGLGASALDALSAPFRFFGSVAGSVFGGILSAASGLWQSFVGWAAALAAVLVSPFQPLIDAAGTAWAAIRAGAEALFGALAGIVGGWWERAKGVFDAVRSLMSLGGEGGGAAKVASPKTPRGQGTPVGAAMPTPPTPPVLPTSVPSLEALRVLPAGPVPALAGPSPTPQVPVVGVGLAPVPDADGAGMASLRGMEQAVIRTMASLVRVLEAAHAKIAAMGVESARAAATPVQPHSVPRVPPVRIDVPRTPPIAPRPVPLPVRTPPIVPAVRIPPAPVKPPAPRPRREVVERGVWGRTRPAGADRALQVVERTANAAQRARSGVRTTASEWERVGRNASRGRIDEALLGAVRSVRSTRQRGEGLARTAGDLWKTIRGPKAPEAAAAPEPAIPPAGPGPEATAAPVAPPVPRMTPPVAPSPAASDRRGGLLGVSLAALMAASTPAFVPPTEAPSAATEPPARMQARDRIPEPRAELLAATRPGPSPQDASAAGRSAGDPVPALLQALIAKVDALADRPIDLTVTTRIDGREVAQAVYKDLRERKIRNYETL